MCPLGKCSWRDGFPLEIPQLTSFAYTAGRSNWKCNVLLNIGFVCFLILTHVQSIVCVCVLLLLIGTIGNVSCECLKNDLSAKWCKQQRIFYRLLSMIFETPPQALPIAHCLWTFEWMFYETKRRFGGTKLSFEENIKWFSNDKLSGLIKVVYQSWSWQPWSVFFFYHSVHEWRCCSECCCDDFELQRKKKELLYHMRALPSKLELTRAMEVVFVPSTEKSVSDVDKTGIPSNDRSLAPDLSTNTICAVCVRTTYLLKPSFCLPLRFCFFAFYLSFRILLRIIFVFGISLQKSNGWIDWLGCLFWNASLSN